MNACEQLSPQARSLNNVKTVFLITTQRNKNFFTSFYLNLLTSFYLFYQKFIVNSASSFFFFWERGGEGEGWGALQFYTSLSQTIWMWHNFQMHAVIHLEAWYYYSLFFYELMCYFKRLKYHNNDFIVFCIWCGIYINYLKHSYWQPETAVTLSVI